MWSVNGGGGVGVGNVDGGEVDSLYGGGGGV